VALWDLENADSIVVMGSNMAENHPVGFRFVAEAQRRGATVIHVDPRFTRTSALANIHAPIRSGTDIAFLGGIIHHILENDLWFRDFVLDYTNIANIIEDGYQDPEQTGGRVLRLQRRHWVLQAGHLAVPGQDRPLLDLGTSRPDAGKVSAVTSRR
jgi:formate dehydrogenase major subunit